MSFYRRSRTPNRVNPADGTGVVQVFIPLPPKNHPTRVDIQKTKANVSAYAEDRAIRKEYKPPPENRGRSPGASATSSSSFIAGSINKGRSPGPTGRPRGRPPGSGRSPGPARNRPVVPSARSPGPAITSHASSHRNQKDNYHHNDPYAGDSDRSSKGHGHYSGQHDGRRSAQHQHYSRPDVSMTSDYDEPLTNRRSRSTVRRGHPAPPPEVPQPPKSAVVGGLSEYQDSLVRLQKHWQRINDKTLAVRQIQADIITKLTHLETFADQQQARSLLKTTERERLEPRQQHHKLTEPMRRPAAAPVKMVSKSEAFVSPGGQPSSEFAVGGRPPSAQYADQADFAVNRQNGSTGSSSASKPVKAMIPTSTFSPMDRRPTDRRPVVQPPAGSSSAYYGQAGGPASGHRPTNIMPSSTSTASSDRRTAGQPPTGPSSASNRARPSGSYTDSGPLFSQKRMKKEMPEKYL